MSRVNQHLKDKHRRKWDRFSVYLTLDSDHIRPLESLLIRIATPVGNSVRGGLAGARDLQRPLRKGIKEYQKDANATLFGEAAVRRRRRTKIKGQRGTLALSGLMDRRQSLRGWYNGREYRASLTATGRSSSMAGYRLPDRGGEGGRWPRHRGRDLLALSLGAGVGAAGAAQAVIGVD